MTSCQVETHIGQKSYVSKNMQKTTNTTKY